MGFDNELNVRFTIDNILHVRLIITDYVHDKQTIK